MFKIGRVLLALFLFFVVASPVFAQAETVNVHFFWSKVCPHCAHEEVFLERLVQEHEWVRVYSYEVGGSRENALLRQVGRELSADVSGVPFTVVGEEYLAGYLNDQTSGRRIEAAVLQAKQQGYNDVVGSLVGLTPSVVPSVTVSLTPTEPTPSFQNGEVSTSGEVHESSGDSPVPGVLTLPILGEIQTKTLSLPAFTFVVALLDGFNPCAMWVLLFLVSLLLGMKDRRRMWILGTTFVVASAFVYFLFLSAWLNLFLFLGFVFWVRLLVGLVALGVGIYYLRDWYVNRDAACRVVGSERRQRMFRKMRSITQRRQLILALIGIVGLAFAVNIIELVCSAGLPAVYTQVLALSNLPRWQYYLYLLFYMLIFMIDDLFVFIAAMTTLKAAGIESKYARFSHLVGGVLMLLIGLALLFKPELLMFG